MSSQLFKRIPLLLLAFMPLIGIGQDLVMESESSSNLQEVRDLLSFEGIDYLKIKFRGQDLKGKAFRLSAREIWNGKTVRDTVIVDSRSLGIASLAQIPDTVFAFTVIGKLTQQNKLKMQFNFPRFSTSREFNAVESGAYSLRNLAEESGLEIGYNRKFYLLAYILPYPLGGGAYSYCEVGSNGKDVENWGEKFGIEHYILFELLFD